jgi:hypothetical protein
MSLPCVGEPQSVWSEIAVVDCDPSFDRSTSSSCTIGQRQRADQYAPHLSTAADGAARKCCTKPCAMTVRCVRIFQLKLNSHRELSPFFEGGEVIATRLLKLLLREHRVRHLLRRELYFEAVCRSLHHGDCPAAVCDPQFSVEIATVAASCMWRGPLRQARGGVHCDCRRTRRDRRWRWIHNRDVRLPQLRFSHRACSRARAR